MYKYNNVFGLGKIINKDGKKYINFSNLEKPLLLTDDLLLENVNDNIINALNNSMWVHSYNEHTRYKGRDYFIRGKVNDFQINDNIVTASITGSDNYTATIRFNNNYTQTTKCTCPVGKKCKHVVAALYYLQDKYDLVQSNSCTNLDETILSFIKSKKHSIKQINNVIDYINNIDLNELLEALEPFFNQKDYNVELLIYLIKMNEKYNNDNFLNINYEYRYYLRNIDTKIDNFQRTISYYENYTGRHFYALLAYCVYNNKYDDLFEYITDYKNDSIDLAIEAYNKANIKNISALKRYLTINIESLDDILLVMNLFEEQDIYELIKHLHLYNIDHNQLNKLSPDLQLEILAIYKDFDKCYSYLIDNEEIFKFNSKKYVQVLASIYKYLKRTYQKKIIVIISKYPNTDLLIDSLTHNYDNIDKYTSDDLFMYYEPSYEVIKFNELSYILIQRLSLLNDIIMEISTSNDRYITELYHEDNPQYSDIGYEYTKLLLDGIYDRFGNEIGLKIQKLKQEIKEEKARQDNEFLNKELNEFNKKSIILSSQNKVHIEYYISSEYNSFLLELKVGINKYYIVKNIIEFLEAFNINKKIKYGKELEFDHILDNLSDDDIDIIKYLKMVYKGFRNYNPRYLSIDNDVTINIINLLKNRYVYINNIRYRVLLNNIKPSINIDENYIINSDINKYEIISNNDKAILLDKENFIINQLDGDIKLYQLVNNSIGKSIEGVKDKFKEIIYSRYQSDISLNEAIKDDFKLIRLKIELYFDFDKNIISYNDKYYKDNNPISINDIISINDLSQIDQLNNYLSQIGFKDKKLIDENDILNFFLMDFSTLKEYCDVYFSESIKNKNISAFQSQKINISYENNLLDVFFEGSIYSDSELEKILNAIKHKKKYVILKGDKLIDLSNAEADEFYDIVNDLNLDKGNLSKHHKLPAYQAFNAYNHIAELNIDADITTMINDISNFKDFDIKVPNILAELREYQIDGFKWLSILEKYKLGGILADDMGLGKTIQVITLLQNNKACKPSLIVCPKSLIFNWRNEFNKFTPNIEVIPIYGNASDRSKIINNINYNEKIIYITSYDSLKLDIDKFNNQFNYVILDEAQYIKNVYAIKSQAVKKINSDYKLALTGTPIENNIIDLWSIFDFIMPGYLDDLPEFKSMFLSSDNYQNKVKIKVSPFILRRTKKAVLKDLPSKFERIVTAEMTKEQRKLYDAHCKLANDTLNAGGSAFDVLHVLTRLRQICVEPNMFLDNYTGISGKMQVLKELISDYIGNHKILIFSQFVKALSEIEKYLDNEKIKYFKITGDTKAVDRLTMCDEFNKNDNDVKIFLISLKAGGTGLNLVGADVVIHLDPWWNQAVEDQATDRTHRIGQTRNVEVIKLICENTIEQRVIELQKLKRDLIDKLISNDDSSITKLSIDDLKFILT